ncbi:[FeFe] hydrogenase H-cluster radical SAM maturase HydE [Acididesulfobacillus acetoxydans]|nr:[FeFe] hydrogenase H-cluster radical SAM maturase HydE [Acididesulfobacillus acetoxydans]
MSALLRRAEQIHDLSRDELVCLLSGREYDREIFAAADRVRRKYVGDEVHLRGLIEFSNICRRNCFYCGLRAGNRGLGRYRLTPEEIIGLARKGREYGYRTVVLQSGEDDYYTVAKMCQIIRELKQYGLAVALSIGEKSGADYAAFREAGADRYLLRIETTDRRLYEDLDPGMSHENRKRCLRDLKRLGYEVGCGSLVGLPGQTIASLADDILYFRSLEADMVGIGPFIPHMDTPLKGAQGGDFLLSLKVMALTRLLLPDSNIPATTAMETLRREGRLLALQSGANVVMPNISELQYRRLYALYPGKAGADESPEESRAELCRKLEGMGRTVGKGYGSRQKLYAREKAGRRRPGAARRENS